MRSCYTIQFHRSAIPHVVDIGTLSDQRITMSIRDRLTARPDIDNDDIPWIIERADAMQAEAAAEEDSHATVEEVVAVGRELDIEEEYIEQAIEELRRERDPDPEPPERNSSWIPAALAAAVLALGVLWAALPDNTAPSPEPPPPPVAEREPSPPAPEAPPTIEPDPPPPKPPAPEEEGLPPTLEQTTTPPPTTPAGSDLVSAVAGDWVLVSYHMLKNDSSFEVAVSEGKGYETRERWRLRTDGTFLHLMGSDLSFSGRYSVSIPETSPVPSVLSDASRFLLTTTDVHANIPGMERPQEFFIGEVRGERLVLFYMGKEIDPKRLPSQAHGFRKSWKGGWTW
jgi:hypothetical protein